MQGFSAAQVMSTFSQEESARGIDPHSSGLCHCEGSPANGTSVKDSSPPHSHALLSPLQLDSLNKKKRKKKGKNE